jgi:hypothetical protein
LDGNPNSKTRRTIYCYFSLDFQFDEEEKKKLERIQNYSIFEIQKEMNKI